MTLCWASLTRAVVVALLPPAAAACLLILLVVPQVQGVRPDVGRPHSTSGALQPASTHVSLLATNGAAAAASTGVTCTCRCCHPTDVDCTKKSPFAVTGTATTLDGTCDTVDCQARCAYTYSACVPGIYQNVAKTKQSFECAPLQPASTFAAHPLAGKWTVDACDTSKCCCPDVLSINTYFVPKSVHNPSDSNSLVVSYTIKNPSALLCGASSTSSEGLLVKESVPLSFWNAGRAVSAVNSFTQGKPGYAAEWMLTRQAGSNTMAADS